MLSQQDCLIESEHYQLTSADGNTKADGSLGLVGAVGVGTVDEVVLEGLALTEAKVHVVLGASGGRVLSNDALETLNLEARRVSTFLKGNDASSDSVQA